MINMVICGLGYISERVAKGCCYTSNMNLYGFLSSNQEKAKAYQIKYNAQAIFTSYEQMWGDDNVDVVYLCTPNHVHHEQIKMCLKNHKHVICEKPMVATIEEIKELFAYAKKQNCFLMEAEKTFFSPLLLDLKDKIKHGLIGEVYYMKAEYNYDIRKNNYPKNHWVFQKNGGCALDVGVYPICFTHFFAGCSVKSAQIIKKNYEDYDCDFLYQALIEYENGISASVKSCWLQEVTNKGVGYIYGTKGYIEIPAYWKDNKAVIHLDGESQNIEVKMESDFTGEIEHVATCIEQGLLESPILGEKESIEILRVI